ncbi:MAG: 4Fe-4S binding protein, partial [Oscillospiraceae bacterium]
MAKMIVDENICKGCGLCVTVCPKKIIKLSEEKLNSKGY